MSLTELTADESTAELLTGRSVVTPGINFDSSALPYHMNVYCPATPIKLNENIYPKECIQNIDLLFEINYLPPSELTGNRLIQTKYLPPEIMKIKSHCTAGSKAHSDCAGSTFMCVPVSTQGWHYAPPDPRPLLQIDTHCAASETDYSVHMIDLTGTTELLTAGPAVDYLTDSIFQAITAEPGEKLPPDKVMIINTQAVCRSLNLLHTQTNLKEVEFKTTVLIPIRNISQPVIHSLISADILTDQCIRKVFQSKLKQFSKPLNGHLWEMLKRD